MRSLSMLAAALLLACVSLSLSSCAASASAPTPPLQLSNTRLSLRFDADTHSIQQFSNLLTTPPTDLLVGGVGGAWWSAYVVSAADAQQTLISADTAATRGAQLVHGTGTTNATFSYTFACSQVWPEGREWEEGTVAAVTFSMQVVLQLDDDASEVQIFFFAQMQAGSVPFGFSNVTLELPRINTQARGADVGDFGVFPSGYGVLQARPTQALTQHVMQYPSSAATYQLMMYYFNESDSTTQQPTGPGLRFETRDPLGSNKFYRYARESAQSFSLSATLFPTNVAQNLSLQTDASGLLIPYAGMWGVFVGDWAAGSRSYADWALSEAQWTRAGLMWKRPSTPDWLLGINFWLNTGWQQLDIFNRTQGDPDVVVERLTKMMSLLRLGSPLAVHWDKILFDTGYPDYFPTKDGFQAALQQLHTQFGDQIKLVPYINGRIFDVAAASWLKDGAEAFSAKAVSPAFQARDYQMYEESYGSGATFSVMCPGTSYWQTKLTGVAQQLQALGVDGLYVDQIGAAVTKPCSDASHGHSLGDGRSWTEGNNAALTTISAAMGGPLGNNSFVVTESNAEPFMSNVQIYLTLVATAVNASGDDTRLVPVFSSIYGGNYIAMGSEYFLSDLLPDPSVYAAKLAWQWHQGIVLGWWSMGGTQTPPAMGLYDSITMQNADGSYVHEAEFAFLRQLDAFRTLGQEYIAMGRRTGDLPFEYASASTDSLHMGEHSFAHPHRNDLRRAHRPRVPKGLAPQAGRIESADAEKELTAYGSWVYSPVEASVWVANDGASLGLFFTCSATPDASNPPAYAVRVSGLNVNAFGVVSGLENNIWIASQYASDGTLIGAYKFADGKNIGLKALLPCRGVIYFQLQAMNSSDAEAQLVAEQ